MMINLALHNVSDDINDAQRMVAKFLEIFYNCAIVTVSYVDVAIFGCFWI